MNNQPTTPHDGQPSAEPFLSRQQYRQQQKAQRHQRPEQPVENTAAPEPAMRRRDFENERADSDQEEKVRRLKRRLNIAIVALVAAIIVVYLILLYVG